MNPKAQVLLLKSNKIMQYDWGSTQNQCLIKRLSQEQHKFYAELWMGTHPNGPSILQSGQTLAEHLSSHPLPFLFKVLNIQKCLSIQLHPNKVQAEQLHKDKPNIYPDDNQKPEMFYTLTDFQCFFGFIGLEDLDRLYSIEPFMKIQNKNDLRLLIKDILSLSMETVSLMVTQLIKTIGEVFADRSQLLKRLQVQFPNDPGILISCLMRYNLIPKGKCFAIASGIPHAYIRGDCLQIMKNSDNVVRLGLTNKIKDAETMMAIMRFQIGVQAEQIVQINDEYLWNGLSMKILHLTGNKTSIELQSQSIGIVLQGDLKADEKNLKFGSTFYTEAGSLELSGNGMIAIGSYK